MRIPILGCEPARVCKKTPSRSRAVHVLRPANDGVGGTKPPSSPPIWPRNSRPLYLPNVWPRDASVRQRRPRWSLRLKAAYSSESQTLTPGQSSRAAKSQAPTGLRRKIKPQHQFWRHHQIPTSIDRRGDDQRLVPFRHRSRRIASLDPPYNFPFSRCGPLAWPIDS